MTDDEKRKAFDAELKKRRAQYLKLRKDTIGEIEKMMQAALEQIQVILRAAPTDYQAWVLPQLEAQIKAAMATLGPKASQAAKEALQESWENGILLVDAPLQAATINITAMLPVIDTRQLVAIQNFTTSKIAGITLEAVNKVNTQLGLVLMGVQTPGDATTNITHILGTTDRSRAVGIIRTELGRVNSIASHQRRLQSAKFLPGMKKMWRKSGRLHPRLYHVAADKQVKPVDEPFKVGGVKMMYPHDPSAPAKEVINCGCIARTWMDSWEVKIPGRAASA